MIEAEACFAPIAISVITKRARQLYRPDMVPAVIMGGNDKILQEQMKTHKNSVTCSFNTSCNCKSITWGLRWSVSQHPSAFPHYHLTNLSSKLQLFRELLFIWQGDTCTCWNSPELLCLTGDYWVLSLCEAEFQITKHLWHHILYISAAIHYYSWYIPETWTTSHDNLFIVFSVCYCETPDGCPDLL